MLCRLMVIALLAVVACSGTSGGHDGGGAVAGQGGRAGAGGAALGGASGGSAGGQASGAGGLQCPSNLEGDCSSSPAGLVCPGAADASTAACACIPGTSGPSWQCAGGPCPATSPGTNGSCTSAQVSTTGAFYGCKYPPSTTCTCETTSDGGTAWSCNDVTCPIQVPTGSCPSIAPGLSCAYEGSDIVCICSPGDGGTPRWFCNGQPTPDCPAAFPGLNGDCSAFRPGTACAYPTVNNIGGRCVCSMGGFGTVWLCPGG